MGKTSPQLAVNFGKRKRRRSRRVRLASRGVPHRVRPEHKARHPVHVTLRAGRGLPSLREQVIFLEMRGALGRTARSWFRVVHFSVQANHVHLLVEADDKASLSRGIMGVAIRMARAVNRVLERHGNVWSERYHSRALKTPREVRNGIVYVLMNRHKHASKATALESLLVRLAIRRMENAALAGATRPNRSKEIQSSTQPPGFFVWGGSGTA